MKIRTAIATAASVLCAAGMAHAQSYVESFDDILQLPANGWFEQNNSVPGLTNYFQGNAVVFAAQATTGYLGTNFNNTSGLNTISNWMVTPVRQLANGQSFAFWTRTVDAPAFPDRLQVRMSLAGSSTNVGTTATSVGDFTTLLLDINPTYTTAGYPNVWTRYEVILSGIAAPTNGRLAFRYFVENAGPSGANSDYIGIDEVVYTSGAVNTGACCLTDGSCIVTSGAACTGQGGIYRGDNAPCATANCPQPATGACCLVTGCQVLTQAQCTAQSGNYAGNNVTCAQANCPPVCANVSAAIGGPSVGWPSTHGQQTSRLFRDGVPDTCVLAAAGGAALAGTFAYDKYDFTNSTGAAACVTVDINTACTGTNFIYAGAYIGGYNPALPDQNNVASIGGSPNPTGRMSFNVPAGTAFSVVFAEVTAGAGCPNYNFVVVGNCSGAAPCYANCDGSSVAPILNVSDFICFQTKYAAGCS